MGLGSGLRDHHFGHHLSISWGSGSGDDHSFEIGLQMVWGIVVMYDMWGMDGIQTDAIILLKSSIDGQLGIDGISL